MSWVIRISLVSVFSLLLAFAGLAQDKAGSSSFQSQEIKFDGHDVRLAGTLLVPKLEAGKRAPGMLIIAGSGATPRDGVVMGNIKQPIYRDLAEHLAGKGIAVLRYDKRCVGESECKMPVAFDDYIDDARGALKFLRSHPQIDPAKVFLFGHSEGGYIAASIGAHDDVKFAGVILAATPGRHLHKLMREQMQNRMAEAGKKPEETSAWLTKYDRVIRGLQNGQTDYSAEKLNDKDPYDQLLLSLIKQREVIVSLLINDPLQIVNNIQSPTLILQGRKDIQIAVKDAQYIEEAMKRADHADATLFLLDDMDHLLKTNKGAASLASYADTSRPLDAAMLGILNDWMQKRLK
ncbi:MAG: alpha/beta hydrolase family protein [Blastocatellales bacterium]